MSHQRHLLTCKEYQRGCRSVSRAHTPKMPSSVHHTKSVLWGKPATEAFLLLDSYGCTGHVIRSCNTPTTGFFFVCAPFPAFLTGDLVRSPSPSLLCFTTACASALSTKVVFAPIRMLRHRALTMYRVSCSRQDRSILMIISLLRAVLPLAS